MNANRESIFPRIAILKPRKIPPLRYLLYSLIAIALGAVFSQLATPGPVYGDKPLSLDLGSPLPTGRAEQARESRRSLDSAQDQGDLFERFSRALETAPDSLRWASLFEEAIAHPLLEGQHAELSDTGTQNIADILKSLLEAMNERQRSTAPEFARLWTQAAHSSQSLYQRALYSSFFDLAWIGKPEELDLAPRRHEWLPGDTIANTCPLACKSYPAKPALRLEVARITLDSSFWSARADILDTIELNPVQQSAFAHPVLQGPALAKPGLYRLTLLHPSFFQEDYVRVSRLRLALGQSPNSLDAWGSSLPWPFFPA